MSSSHWENIRHYLNLLWLPLSLLFVFTTIHLLWQVLSMPAAGELANQIQVFFDTYGLPALFVVSIIEAMLLIGGYFPGGFVIVVAVLLADSIPEAAGTVVVAVAGLFVGHVFNYLLGKYGWYKLLIKFNLAGSLESAKKRLRKRGLITAFGTYWVSSVAAVLDTAAGILHISWYRFVGYSLAFTAFWGIFFGSLFYIVGDTALKRVAPEGSEFILMLTVMLLWIAGIIVWKKYKRNCRHIED